MALIEEAHKAAELLLDHAYVRLVSRDEPDAVCAAVLLGHALRRENVDFHYTALPRLDEAAAKALADEKNDALVLIGLSGDADLEGAALLAGRRVVLDRETPTLEAERSLHPGQLSERNAAAPLGALAYYIALSLSKRNRDLAILAIAGAYADGGHVPELKGLAADVLAQSEDSDTLLAEPGLALHGSNVEQALTHLDNPYVSGVTGRARNVKRLVQELHVSGDSAPTSLKDEQKERLGSFLTLRLLTQDAPDAALPALYRRNVRALAGPHTGLDAATLGRQAEAACASGRAGLAFAALWPDTNAGSELLPLQSQTRDALVAALLRAERDKAVQGPLVIVEAPDAKLCGPLALRAAVSLTPAQRIAVARHTPEEGDTTLALRAFGRTDIGAVAHRAADATGAHVSAHGSAARVSTSDPDGFLKAFAEGLA